MMNTPDVLIRTVKVETWLAESRLTNASGFFYFDAGLLYLITNRHVVLNEATGHAPDSLRLLLHTNAADLTQNEAITVPLYREGVPQWFDHPRKEANIDVVAVLVSDLGLLTRFHLAAFEREDILGPEQSLPPGQAVLIIGFPLGFHDTVHNLPIVRQATVASDFAHPFKGEPYFLTDARMHRGTSGAPVVAHLLRPTHIAGKFDERICLLGVHSASLDVSDRDPTQDDRLGLNCAWYSTLVMEIIEAGTVQRLQQFRDVQTAAPITEATSPPTIHPARPASATEDDLPASETPDGEPAVRAVSLEGSTAGSLPENEAASKMTTGEAAPVSGTPVIQAAQISEPIPPVTICEIQH